MNELKTVESFEQATGGKRSVVVFSADWCPDCRRLEMFIDDIKAGSTLDWYEVDRDELLELTEKQEVRGIPSLLVYENGEKIGHLHSANAKTPEEVAAFIGKY